MWRRFHPMLAAACVLGLGACHALGEAPVDGAATPASPSTRGAASTDPAAAPSSDSVIRGRATYRERVKMPPGASLVVELVDTRDGTVRGATTVRDVAGPPIPFSLRVDSPGAGADGAHAVQARLVGPDGETWFSTAVPQPIPSGSRAPLELLLERTPASEATPVPVASASATPMHWECGELGVLARLDGDTATLDANGTRWTLARAGSITRYADARGNAFWTEGDSARLARSGEDPRDCVPASQPSPWNEALLRGVAFRASGSEPGWFVEVGGGPSFALRATLDYGERRIDVAPMRATPEGFVGTAPDGTPVRVIVSRGACVDGMSGQRFEARTRLVVGDRGYTGCGAFLRD